MPLVDGVEATRMIRELERDPLSPVQYSQRVDPYGRIPIVAVSASLSERRVQEYVENGFDGWILKPIDFKRLERYFQGNSRSTNERSVTVRSWRLGKGR
jgi:CheY-like chemotaxis protein